MREELFLNKYYEDLKTVQESLHNLKAANRSDIFKHILQKDIKKTKRTIEKARVAGFINDEEYEELMEINREETN